MNSGRSRFVQLLAEEAIAAALRRGVHSSSGSGGTGLILRVLENKVRGLFLPFRISPLRTPSFTSQRNETLFSTVYRRLFSSNAPKRGANGSHPCMPFAHALSARRSL